MATFGSKENDLKEILFVHPEACRLQQAAKNRLEGLNVACVPDFVICTSLDNSALCGCGNDLKYTCGSTLHTETWFWEPRLLHEQPSYSLLMAVNLAVSEAPLTNNDHFHLLCL